MKSIKEIFRSHAVIDTDGRHVNGSDKQSNHNYSDAYESLFVGEHTKVGGDIVVIGERYYPSTRDSVKLVMEIGVADGSCLLAWREIFPNATIVGMDIHPAAKVYNRNINRIEFHFGNQCIKEDCELAAAGRQFDLIVEDATHHLLDTLITLYWLWPFVAPGGLYVVEEWENVCGSEASIRALWPNVEIVKTVGPFGGVEPLVVFRKPK